MRLDSKFATTSNIPQHLKYVTVPTLPCQISVSESFNQNGYVATHFC